MPLVGGRPRATLCVAGAPVKRNVKNEGMEAEQAVGIGVGFLAAAALTLMKAYMTMDARGVRAARWIGGTFTTAGIAFVVGGAIGLFVG